MFVFLLAPLEDLITNLASPPYIRIYASYRLSGIHSKSMKTVALSLTASFPRSKTIGSDRDPVSRR